MPIRNLHWYDRNEGTKYPLDDQSTAVDDKNKFLPSNIVVDVNLRWPAHLGDYAYLSAVSVTETLVTVVILAAYALDDSGVSPLAVLSVPRPVDQNRVYALLPQVPGVGGWIVFGPGVEDTPYMGRFSRPRQSRLAPRAASRYRPLPVSSVQAIGADSKLTGVVRLSALTPLEIAKEQREIEGVTRDCVVVRLVDGAGADGYPVPSQAAEITGYKEQSTFKDFAGPCAGRPESGTCGDPQPIESINGIVPDCDGVLSIEFRGCADVGQIIGNSECGIVVDCGLGLAVACPAPQIPSSDGILTDEYTPVNIEPPVEPEPPTPTGMSESLVISNILPHLDCFSDGVATDFVVHVGVWTYIGDDSLFNPCGDDQFKQSASISQGFSLSLSSGRNPVSLAAESTFSRNVILWEGLDDSTTHRAIQTEVKLVDGPLGSLHNGGVVLNYKLHPTIAGLHVYYLVEVDYESQSLRISKWTGTNFSPVVPVDLPGIQLNEWYRLYVTVVPDVTTGQTVVTARITTPEDPGAIDATVVATVNDYAPSTGRFGFGSNRAISYFSYISVNYA